jgi:Flp pilus assembly protein TadD
MASQVAAIKAIKASIQSQSYDAALTAAAKALAEAPNNVDLLTLAAFAATRKGDVSILRIWHFWGLF